MLQDRIGRRQPHEHSSSRCLGRPHRYESITSENNAVPRVQGMVIGNEYRPARVKGTAKCNFGKSSQASLIHKKPTCMRAPWNGQTQRNSPKALAIYRTVQMHTDDGSVLKPTTVHRNASDPSRNTGIIEGSCEPCTTYDRIEGRQSIVHGPGHQEGKKINEDICPTTLFIFIFVKIKNIQLKIISLSCLI